ncbi:MAG: signal peptidase I, partial [Planctomycetota bacterium]
MAKKNKKNRRSPNERRVPPLPSQKPAADAAKKEKKPTNHQATRETVESLVIALVLAFLFRTFQAEAFVIPTGSMAPTLMGQHKDVYCEQCGQRFKVNASNEADSPSQLDNKIPGFRNSELSPRRKLYGAQTIAGVCQNCRYPMPFVADLPASVPETKPGVSFQNTSSGDRILVNKYLYSFTDPARWDVVVFKYPGDAKQNYIKRLVGLPGETLRIYQGDVYTRPGVDADSATAYEILRKPADKVMAMRQLVHDTDHDPASLFEAGWPLRWGPEGDTPGAAEAIEASEVDTWTADTWTVDTEIKGKNVRQVYRIAGESDAESDAATSWLRYTHTPAPANAWRAVRERLANDQPLEGVLGTDSDAEAPRLITDFNSYNTEVPRWRLTIAEANRLPADVGIDGEAEGLHWAGDLIVDAELEVDSTAGA